MASEVAGHGAACDFAAVLDADLGGGNADEGDGGDPPGLVDDRDDAGGDVEDATTVGDAVPEKKVPKKRQKTAALSSSLRLYHISVLCAHQCE